MYLTLSTWLLSRDLIAFSHHLSHTFPLRTLYQACMLYHFRNPDRTEKSLLQFFSPTLSIHCPVPSPFPGTGRKRNFLRITVHLAISLTVFFFVGRCHFIPKSCGLLVYTALKGASRCHSYLIWCQANKTCLFSCQPYSFLIWGESFS